MSKEAPGYGPCSINFLRQLAQALRHNGAFFESTFHSKNAFFLLQSDRKTERNWSAAAAFLTFPIMALAPSLLWWHTLASVALLKAENLFKSMVLRSEKQADQFSPFSAADCYEKNAIWWRHLAPKKVAPISNGPMDSCKKLIDCNTVSDGYFDTLWTFVDAF